MLRLLLIGVVQFCLLYALYIRPKFCTSERLESIRVLGADRRCALMIRVKVNSKSELVENREEKSALYRCNLLL